MSILKVITAVAIFATLSIGVKANTPKTETKTDAKATTEVAVSTDASANSSSSVIKKTGDDDEAAFQYISGDVNSASSYGTTQVSGSDLCPTAGSHRCAATFAVDENGNRIGNPTTPVWTKP